MKKSRKTEQKPKEQNSRLAEEHPHDRLVLTKDNVNTHLLAYLEDPQKYSIVGVLTYLFKTFQDEPAELLAKIKILTSKKKGIAPNHSIQKSVLSHLFAIFNMKDDFFQNMFKIMKSEGFLPHLICSFYFKTSMSTEDVEEHLSVLFGELQKAYEPLSAVSLSEFKIKAAKLMECSEVEETDFISDESTCSENAAAGIDKVVEEHNREFEESDASLISLDDDEQIAALDKKLGAILCRPEAAGENTEFLHLISQCLEMLIQNNYISNIEWLWNIMYLSQFSQISLALKFILKDFVEKFSDKASLFKMFHAAALLLPDVYILYTVFSTTCGKEFNYPVFFKNSLTRGHAPFLLDRIDSAKYYALYNPEMGGVYDEFYKALLMKEPKMEKLLTQKERELPEELSMVVSEAIKSLEKRKAKRLRNKRRSANKRAAHEDNLCDEAVEEKDSAKEDKKPAARKEPKEKSPPPKKRSFADKVGKNLVTKKKENRKNFRYARDGENEKKSLERKKEYFKKRFRHGTGQEE